MSASAAASSEPRTRRCRWAARSCRSSGRAPACRCATSTGSRATNVRALSYYRDRCRERLAGAGQPEGPTMTKGTLIAAMSMAHAAEDEFHDWYDTEHLPERQRVPGFLVCQRWIGAHDRTVSVATYDLDTVAVLKSPSYLAIGGGNPSPRAEGGMARVAPLF